ncbi:hypothetical protein OG753_19960 [Streptomyces sp. NBC_00029]
MTLARTRRMAFVIVALFAGRRVAAYADGSSSAAQEQGVSG